MKCLIVKSLFYPNRDEGVFVQLLGSLCRSLVYVEYDDDDEEKRADFDILYNICLG